MTSSALPKEFLRLSQALAAMKGIAILLIVMYHLWGFTKGYLSFTQIAEAVRSSGVKKALVEGVFNTLCLLGQQGVHFFLIASGFGLTASWWQKGGSTATHPLAVIPFWKRRLARIFPPYWLAHVLAIALFLIRPGWVIYGSEIWQQGFTRISTALFLSLTTLRNFFADSYFFLNGAWWYVGLSVQLYLIFPWLIQLGRRYGWSRLLLGSLVVSCLYRGLVIAGVSSSQVMDALLRGAIFPSRLFEFVLGMVLAIALLRPDPQPDSPPDALSWLQNFLIKRQFVLLSAFLYGVGLFCSWAALPQWKALLIPADALVGTGEFCLLFQLLSWLPQNLSILNWIGDRSYGIYLTHMNFYPALWAVLIKLLPIYWLCFGLVTLLLLGLGGIFEQIYSFLEKQFFRLTQTSHS